MDHEEAWHSGLAFLRENWEAFAPVDRASVRRLASANEILEKSATQLNGSLVSLFRSLLPQSCTGGAWYRRLLSEVRREHDWFSVLFFYSPSESRVVRLAVAGAALLTLMFFDAVFYVLVYPDDGTCSSMTSQADCEATTATYDDSRSICTWQQGAPPTTSGSLTSSAVAGSPSWCEYSGPHISVAMMIAIASLTMMFATPVLFVLRELIGPVLASAVAVRPHSVAEPAHARTASPSEPPQSSSHLRESFDSQSSDPRGSRKRYSHASSRELGAQALQSAASSPTSSPSARVEQARLLSRSSLRHFFRSSSAQTSTLLTSRFESGSRLDLVGATRVLINQALTNELQHWSGINVLEHAVAPFFLWPQESLEAELAVLELALTERAALDEAQDHEMAQEAAKLLALLRAARAAPRRSPLLMELQRAREESEHLVSVMENATESERSEVLLRSLILEQLSEEEARVMRRVFTHEESVELTAHPLLMHVLCWALLLGYIAFVFAYLVLFGARNTVTTTRGWVTSFALSFLQDVLVYSPARLLVFNVLAVASSASSVRTAVTRLPQELSLLATARMLLLQRQRDGAETGSVEAADRPPMVEAAFQQLEERGSNIALACAGLETFLPLPLERPVWEEALRPRCLLSKRPTREAINAFALTSGVYRAAMQFPQLPASQLVLLRFETLGALHRRLQPSEVGEGEGEGAGAGAGAGVVSKGRKVIRQSSKLVQSASWLLLLLPGWLLELLFNVFAPIVFGLFLLAHHELWQRNRGLAFVPTLLILLILAMFRVRAHWRHWRASEVEAISSTPRLSAEDHDGGLSFVKSTDIIEQERLRHHQERMRREAEERRLAEAAEEMVLRQAAEERQRKLREQAQIQPIELLPLQQLEVDAGSVARVTTTKLRRRSLSKNPSSLLRSPLEQSAPSHSTTDDGAAAPLSSSTSNRDTLTTFSPPAVTEQESLPDTSDYFAKASVEEPSEQQLRAMQLVVRGPRDEVEL